MLDTSCVFCKIIKRHISANIVYEDKNLIAFEDLHPQAPVHIILIPKYHISNLNDLTTENSDIIKYIIIAAKQIAEKFNIKLTGYRLICNCGNNAGQSVHHLHFHLLGGIQMQAKMI